MPNMKIVFFGTPGFAAANLKYLIDNGNDIVGVVTTPDSKTGRGKKIKPSKVKEVALTNNIAILQPEKLRADEFIQELITFNADLFVVVAFRMLPEVIWEMPKNGTINLHTSLLPNYRGAAPINRVLINGEKETGISTFFIDNKIDSGAIIKQEKVKLSNMTTAAQLHDKLINKGNLLLISTLNEIENRSVVQTTQQEHNRTNLEAPKLTKELLKIDWHKPASDIHNLVRGLSPYLDDNTLLKDVAICPSAFFYLNYPGGNNKRIKVHLTEIIKSQSNDLLQIKTDNKSYLHIITKKNIISILNLQVEGKNPVTIKQFLHGIKITEEYEIS